MVIRIAVMEVSVVEKHPVISTYAHSAIDT